jgi:hypothetical protein
MNNKMSQPRDQPFNLEGIYVFFLKPDHFLFTQKPKQSIFPFDICYISDIYRIGLACTKKNFAYQF